MKFLETGDTDRSPLEWWLTIPEFLNLLPLEFDEELISIGLWFRWGQRMLWPRLDFSEQIWHLRTFFWGVTFSSLLICPGYIFGWSGDIIGFIRSGSEFFFVGDLYGFCWVRFGFSFSLSVLSIDSLCLPSQWASHYSYESSLDRLWEKLSMLLPSISCRGTSSLPRTLRLILNLSIL